MYGYKVRTGSYYGRPGDWLDGERAVWYLTQCGLSLTDSTEGDRRRGALHAIGHLAHITAIAVPAAFQGSFRLLWTDTVWEGLSDTAKRPRTRPEDDGFNICVYFVIYERVTRPVAAL